MTLHSPARQPRELHSSCQLRSLCDTPDSNFCVAERLDFTRGCRFISQVVVVPRADRDYDGFVRALNSLLASEPDAILVPVIEETLYVACAVQRGHLTSCRVFAPQRDIVEVLR